MGLERCAECFCCSVCRRDCGCEARVWGEEGGEELEEQMVKRVLGIPDTEAVVSAESSVMEFVREEEKLFEESEDDEEDEDDISDEEEAEEAARDRFVYRNIPFIE